MPELGLRLMPRLTVGLVLMACGVFVSCAPVATSSSQPVRTNQVDLPPSYQFAPANIEVRPGTMVMWTNHDNFTHSVEVQGQTEVHMLRPGESIQISFDQPGTYPYVCTLHTQNMRGTVVVTAA
jgi:plastocyanin